MVTSIEAVFDGAVFRPMEPPALAPNTRVRIAFESLETEQAEPESFFVAARRIKLEGPPDWSANFDKYLQEERRPHDE